MRLFRFSSIPGWSRLLLHCGLFFLHREGFDFAASSLPGGFSTAQGSLLLVYLVENYLYYLVSM